MMMEIFDGLNNLSIEELHLVIARSQELLELKEKEALRLAQLEKEKLERERLEKERKRLEEIEELKRRLQELEAGGASAPIPEVKPEPKPVKEKTVTPDVPKKVLEPVQIMDGSLSKWVVFDGEQDVFSWKQIRMSAPEEGSKKACYLKLTNRRILISSESAAKAGVRVSAFGVLGSLIVEEKGKPWIAMPLGAVDYFKRMNKNEMVIQADRKYVFKLSQADELYTALKSLMPEQAQ